jgi:hypothetical protein
VNETVAILSVFVAAVVVALGCIGTRAARRWRGLIGRQLKRRNLVCVPSDLHVSVLPAEGYWLIGMCMCEREGLLFHVVFLSRRRSRTKGLLSLVVAEWPAA